MSFLNRSISGVCLAWLALGWMRAAAQPRRRPPPRPASTQPASAVRGTVTAEGDVPLAEMVVYLESAERRGKRPKPSEDVKVSQKGGFAAAGDRDGGAGGGFSE